MPDELPQQVHRPYHGFQPRWAFPLVAILLAALPAARTEPSYVLRLEIVDLRTEEIALRLQG